MERYDPDIGPDPESWRSLDDDERLAQVEAGTSECERLPRGASPRLHAMIHLIVESQIAMGDGTPVASVLQRLLAAGVGRHDAIHAIGSVLSKHVYRSMRSGDAAFELNGDPNESYWRELDDIAPESWRNDR